MKVNGPGQPAAPEVTEAGASPVDAAAGPRPLAPGELGPSFADRLGGPRAGAPAGASEPGRAAVAPAGSAPVADAGAAAIADAVAPMSAIGADLRAGKLTPRAAVERVLELVLARQVDPEAPAAVRDAVRAALRDSLEGDPLLAEKIRQLA